VLDTPPPPSAPTRGQRARSRLRAGAGFAAGIAAALVAILVYNAVVHGPAPITTGDVASQIAGALASVTPPPAYSQQAYAAIQPSLVEVRTRDASPTGSGAPGTSAAPGASPELDGSLGSGVVIDTKGDILTALHVVADATQIQVTFADGTVSQAQISTKDAEHDIAVLQPLQPPATIVPATLGDPSPPIGSDAFAVGNPFGLDGSITAGVVSALGRSFQPVTGGPVLHDLIQIDAAVNPGNSGGPLVDRYGRVMGIVTGLINPSRQDVFIGIGLATPINIAGGAAGLPND
jgi:S1-C subfamily serine protease